MKKDTQNDKSAEDILKPYLSNHSLDEMRERQQAFVKRRSGTATLLSSSVDIIRDGFKPIAPTESLPTTYDMRASFEDFKKILQYKARHAGLMEFDLSRHDFGKHLKNLRTYFSGHEGTIPRDKSIWLYGENFVGKSTLFEIMSLYTMFTAKANKYGVFDFEVLKEVYKKDENILQASHNRAVYIDDVSVRGAEHKDYGNINYITNSILLKRYNVWRESGYGKRIQTYITSNYAPIELYANGVIEYKMLPRLEEQYHVIKIG